MSCVGRNDDTEGNSSSLEVCLAVPLSSVKSAAGLVHRTSLLHLCLCKAFASLKFLTMLTKGYFNQAETCSLDYDSKGQV